MDLELSDDHKDLAEIARHLLDRHAPIQLAREYLSDGSAADPAALWRAVDEAGWYAVGMEEDDPFGLPGLSLLSREWGRHVAPGPIVDTALAVRVAAALCPAAEGDEEMASLAAGNRTAALAVIEEAADWSLRGVCTTAVGKGTNYVLNGAKVGVAHGARADFFAVLADLDGEPAWLLVAKGSPGVEIEPERGLDPTVDPARVIFNDTPVPGGRVDTATGAGLERLLAIGAVATAAEGLGAASQALDLAVQYALERRQFGRVIGSFQSLSHVLAEAHVLRETAWSTILYASAALADDTEDSLEAASIAKAYASPASRDVVEAACQVFGGVAFTWEHDAHLYQRRTLECEQRFGDAIHHEAALAKRIVPAALATR